jgi:predicted nucleic acid-binding protein
MLIVSACKIFLDTNILIYQTFEDFDAEKHNVVQSKLKILHESEHIFYISTQIIREFIAIATNDKIFHAPLRTEDVLVKINEFEASFHVLFDTDESLAILKDLVKRYDIRKQKVHDTNIAATVLANRIDYLWTFNKKDFEIFEGLQLLQ